MRICVISTTILHCPPAGYSGLEQLAYQQAAGLSLKGHKVMLVAPVGSTPPAGVELHGTTIGEPEKQAYSGYWQRLPEFDAIIDNSWQKWSYILKMEGKLNAPILGVLHAPCNTMYGVPPPVNKPCFVAISEDQAVHGKECWKINVKAIHNGIDMSFYKPNGMPRSDRYLFLARMSRIKGPHIAFNVAKKCGVALDLVGDDKITGEPELAKTIRDNATGNIVYHGGVPRTKCIEFFNTGKALLHMNQEFREPFGLAPVEAMACGCPVIAFDNGAMRETIRHGETGFLVKTQDEVEDLVKANAVVKINPQKCREWAATFTIERMIDNYEAACTEAIKTGGW
jgi:glycosyltransferase involved in cell wall biosynthesis